MRKPILRGAAALATALPMLPGCGPSAPAVYTVIEEVPDRATPVRCERFHVAGDPAPTEVRLATDSTWTVLDGPGREVVELDAELRVVARTPIPALGPGAAEHPVSVAPLGDTAWAVAARGGLRLVTLTRAGDALASLPLDFIPHSLAAAGDGTLLLTAMPFGTKPPTLAVRVADGRIGPLPVPRRAYADMTVNALGNTALVETLSDGSAVVVHQFLAPRAFRVAPDGDVSAVVMPTPAGTRDHIEYVPQPPITEDQLPGTLLPAMALSVDRTRGEVYVLTRSGRQLRGRPERVVLRLREDFRFVQAYLLDVPAAGMAVLPGTGTAVVYDDLDRFFACPLRAAGADADATTGG